MIVVCLPSPNPNPNPTNNTIMLTDANQSLSTTFIPLPGLTSAIVSPLMCVRKELEDFFCRFQIFYNHSLPMDLSSC